MVNTYSSETGDNLCKELARVKAERDELLQIAKQLLAMEELKGKNVDAISARIDRLDPSHDGYVGFLKSMGW